jgi:hypothetical protein
VVEVGERRGNKGEERFGITNCLRLSLIDERWKSVLRKLAGGSVALLLVLLVVLEVAPIDVGGCGTTWLLTEADFLP